MSLGRQAFWSACCLSLLGLALAFGAVVLAALFTIAERAR